MPEEVNPAIILSDLFPYQSKLRDAENRKDRKPRGDAHGVVVLRPYEKRGI